MSKTTSCIIRLLRNMHFWTCAIGRLEELDRQFFQAGDILTTKPGPSSDDAKTKNKKLK